MIVLGVSVVAGYQRNNSLLQVHTHKLLAIVGEGT